MGLRDLLKKKDQLEGGAGADAEILGRLNTGPEFTFIRSDTHTQEIIHPPTTPRDDYHLRANDNGSGSANKARRSLDVFRSSRSRAGSASSVKSDNGGGNGGAAAVSALSPRKDSSGRRLSQRLHLSRDKTPTTSDYVPGDLPQISVTQEGGPGDEREWEKRATMLAQAADENERRRSRSPSVASASVPTPRIQEPPPRLTLNFVDGDASAPGPAPAPGPPPKGVVSTKTIDEDIQTAIQLHEEGALDQSTSLFGRLADPQGANNPLSQVLYGLALR